MGKNIYNDIMCGNSDANIRFADIRHFLLDKGFKERIKGDHFIYKHPDIPDRINIQPNGNKAKAYQVKQIRQICIKYEIKEDE